MKTIAALYIGLLVVSVSVLAEEPDKSNDTISKVQLSTTTKSQFGNTDSTTVAQKSNVASRDASSDVTNTSGTKEYDLPYSEYDNGGYF